MTKIKSLRLLTMCVCCLAVAACGQKHAAEQMVRNGLKDPDSAKFGDFYYNSTTKKACLTVNAKNAMGGYTGDKQFELIREKDGWSYVNEIEDVDSGWCRQNYADTAD